jgi:signal transduction histidine kinase
MKISHFIFFGFLIILILFSITTFINFRQAEKVNENSEWFARSTTVVRSSNRFQRNILNMVSGLRGYLLTGENYFIQAYDSAAMENENILKEISALISSNPQQQKSFRDILRLNDRWITEFANPLVSAKKVAGSSDSSLLSFNRLYRQKLVSGNEQNINRALQARFRDFSNYEYELREFREHALTESIAQTRRISFYLTTLSIGIGLAVAIFLAYKISSRILRMVKMADSIAEGNYEVSTEDTGKDELSQLAKALNRMASVLSENINLLKRKNQELDQFAHIVSHDLKAPLRGIDNVVTWIEEDHTNELSPKMQEYLLLIKGRLIRAENLIKGILSYARVGREMPEREPVDLNVLMNEVRENVPLHQGLILEIQPNLPTIVCERIPLQQVLANLVGNAIKYHDKENGRIKVYMQSKKDVYVFFVEDNGPGISRNYHDKIFMIFQTLHERDSFESTGVGLAIVKKILDDRNQTIDVNSEPGKGSVFSFTWPK